MDSVPWPPSVITYFTSSQSSDWRCFPSSQYQLTYPLSWYCDPVVLNFQASANIFPASGLPTMTGFCASLNVRDIQKPSWPFDNLDIKKNIRIYHQLLRGMDLSLLHSLLSRLCFCFLMYQNFHSQAIEPILYWKRNRLFSSLVMLDIKMIAYF